MAAHFLHTICTFPEYWGFLRKERTDSPIRLRPKAYARLTGILNTRYPGLKEGEIRFIQTANRQYKVKADGYGGMSILEVHKIK